MSLLDKIEALVLHKHATEQLANVLSQPIVTHVVSTESTAMSTTVSLPQLSLIPNVSSILGTLAQATGLQSVFNAFQSAQNIIKAGDYTPATIDAFLTDVRNVLTSVGSYMPGSPFANLEAEIAKYEEIASKIESGQSVEIADVVYTSKSGLKFDCVLNLSVKAQTQA